MKQRRYPAAALGPAVITSTALLLWWLEGRRPLRRTVEPRAVRHARNLAIAATAAAAVQLVELPLVEPLSRHVAASRWGILGRLNVRPWVRTSLTLLLLDYTLYIWHVIAHRSRAVWRFHAVHHIDRDLDASTAIRFHFGELVISVPWRAMQVALIGVHPRQLRIWQRLLLLSILFHHSNVKLPAHVERRLAWFVMTPRLHGIHHADVESIRDANWSSGLTLWDWLHGTLRNDVPQEAITIGVSHRQSPEHTALRAILTAPFTPDRP
jgi:sterol desaturase/sphingolipid hydroxylase (fatty acid hydroxylase superfamily)